MATGGYFTTGSILAFMFLGIIRGSFSVVIYFAVLAYQSPSLVFLLRCPGTIILYVGFIIYLAISKKEDKETLLHSLRNVSNLWKCAVMGLVQLAAPYLLFMYGLKILNPTAGGVFMAAAPWFAAIIERLPMVQHKSSLTAVKVFAMILGFAGILLISIADTSLAFAKKDRCERRELPISNATTINSTVTNGTSNHTSNTTITPHPVLVCLPYTTGQVTAALLALIGGSIMWAISSVFWKAKKGNVHYVIGGVMNNLFGGFFVLIVFGILSQFEDIDQVDWRNEGGILSILFLTLFSGFIAAIIVDYLYKTVGPMSSNRVICLVPLVAWMGDWMFVRKFSLDFSTAIIVLEVIGLVLVFVGLVSSSLEPEGFKSSLHTPLLNPGPDERVDDSRPFNDDIPDMDDGVTSEEEIENGSYSRSASLHRDTENAFPPIVEVKRDDQNPVY